MTEEINDRITKAKRIIACLNGILWNKSITKKFNIYEIMINSVMLYGCKTWRLTERNKRALEATEMDAIWSSMRISQKEKVKNETIKQCMGVESLIADNIEKKRLVCYEYVQKMDGNRYPKQIMKWILPGRRKRKK